MIRWTGSGHASPDVDGEVELQAGTSKSCRRRLCPNRRPPDTSADYQKMIRWMESGHASPDVDGDDVWVRLKSVVSERGDSRLVGD
jgi:hypothetical protein